MATQPILTIQFNVETDWPKYTTNTSNLRDKLKDATAPACFGLPVLPIEVHDLKASRKSWLAIVLETNKTHKKAEAGKEEVKKKITLRLRSQNLYLDAYQNVDGKWFEYKSAGGRLYEDPESQELSECDGSYAQLGQGIENAPPDQPQPKPAEARKRIPVGKEELIEAVNELADLTDGSTVDARKYQIVVIGMICESLRFEKITQLLTSGVTHTTLPDWMYSIVVNWSTLSRSLLTAAAGGEFKLRKKDSDAIGIKTQEQAVAATGMVKRPRQVPPPSPSQVVAEGIQESNNYKQSLFAEAMVEVFELRIQRIDGKSSARIYGTLTVDEVFTHFLFSRGRSNPESVRPGFTPLLTGPPADFISASDPFAINIDLKDADTNREISRGTIEWNVYNLGPGKYYNRLMQEEVRGTYGSATLSYAVFSSAVSATIEITLVNGANVFGRVDASNTSIRQGGQSVLFHKEKEQNVNVRPRQLVPLSRSIVALPTNSNLSVRAELWNASSRDDEIANGTASFRPQMEGTSTQRISGRHGAIEVRVTWNKF